jgi:hypothetical protein
MTLQQRRANSPPCFSVFYSLSIILNASLALLLSASRLLQLGLNVIARHSALFPHEAKGIRAFYDTCWRVFNCLDAMPLLWLEDPAYLAKVFFKAPLACLMQSKATRGGVA